MLTEDTTAPLILLVEDDPGHVAAIRRAFEAAPEQYRLQTAGTLRGAREVISTLPPALVLTDYQLPDGHGSELIAAAQGAFPVVLMTAMGSERIAVKALKAGIQDYVVKNAENFLHLPETIKLSLKTWAQILARREAEEMLRRYSRRLIEMEENLRKKLATELHDEIARDLTVLGMNLSIISAAIPDSAPDNLPKRIDDSTRLIGNISRTTRNLMASLRPPVLDDYGLVSALLWHSELFSDRSGITVSVQADEHAPRLPSEIEITLFRICQEALMNAAKHAHARNVTITLDIDAASVRFTVADDGTGLAAPPASHGQDSGWGLTIMRERAELAGGCFSLESQPGLGTTVTVDISLEATPCPSEF